MTIGKFTRLLSLSGQTVLLGILLFGSANAAENFTDSTESANPGPRVSLDSFVNVHYRCHPPLDGWLTTHSVIQESLKSWFPDLMVRQAITDGAPKDLEVFLNSLPGTEDCDVSLVYLGSYQFPEGGWEFVGGEQQLWERLLGQATIQRHPSRIVILDACYAAAVLRSSEWSNKLAALSLFASNERERTYELDLSLSTPIDFRRRYPRAWQWFHQHFSEGQDQKISFLGLIWLRAFVETPAPPRNLRDWQPFFERCQQLAAEFKKKHNRRWASTIQSFPQGEPESK